MKKLEGMAYIPDVTRNADSVYVYGNDGSNQFYRWPVSSGFDDPDSTRQSGFAFPVVGPVAIINKIFSGSKHNLPDGEVYVILQTDTVNFDYELHRSTDSGDNFTKVYTFQRGNLILDRGFTVGFPSGNKLYSMVEYNGNRDVNQRLLTSADGVNWSAHTTWDIESDPTEGVRPFKHIHLIQWNTTNNKFYISVGDSIGESGMFIWDGVEAVPAVSVSELRDSHGFTVLTGPEGRAIDLQFTSAAIVWGADNESNIQAQKGILRCSPNLQNLQRIDLGDHRKSSATTSFMWTGLIVDGQFLLTDDHFDTADSADSYLSVYSADLDRFGETDWREIGRHYTKDGQSAGNLGFWESGGFIGFSVSGQGGKSELNGTSVSRLSTEDWQDFIVGDEVLDNEGFNYQTLHAPTLSPLYFVNSSGNDGNGGETVADAWLTFDHAVLNGKVPHGAGVIVDLASEVVALAGFTTHSFNINSSSPNPTSAGHPTTFRGRGKELTSITYSSHSESRAIDAGSASNSIVLQGMNAKDESVTGNALIQSVTDSSWVFIDVRLGAGDQYRAGFRSNTGTKNFYAHNSEILNDEDDLASVIYAVDIQDQELFAFNTLISGAYRALFLRGDGASCDLNNCVLDKYQNTGAIFSAAANTSGSIKVRRGAFKSGDGSTVPIIANNATLDSDGTNVYDVAPSGNLQTNKVIDFDDHFVSGDPRQGLQASSSLIATGHPYFEPSFVPRDSVGGEYFGKPSPGWIERTDHNEVSYVGLDGGIMRPIMASGY